MCWCADTSIYVGAYNNLCVQIDIRKDRVEHVAKSFVLSVVAGEVHIHKRDRDVFAFDAFTTVVKGGNLSLRQIILPENSSSGSVVIGERDPAACHAW